MASSETGAVRVVIAYFRDRSRYPRSGPTGEQDLVYWKNIAVSVATLRHVAGRSVRITVFAGGQPPSEVGPVLDPLDAEIRIHPFDHQPPEGFFGRYVGSLYLLDAMAALASEVDPADTLLFADPDIAWVAPLGPLVEEVHRGGVVAYDLRVPPTVPMCDLTRIQQGEVLAEISGHGPEVGAPLIHFGGELYGMSGVVLAEVVPRVEALWSATLERFARGEPHYAVEEHLVNAVLWERGEQEGRANEHIERIRTLPRPMGTRERVRPGLVAWHLPLEKDEGFLSVFDHLARGGTLPSDLGTHRRWLARHLGIAPSPARWLLDRARQVRWVATGRWWNHGAAARYGL